MHVPLLRQGKGSDEHSSTSDQNKGIVHCAFVHRLRIVNQNSHACIHEFADDISFISM